MALFFYFAKTTSDIMQTIKGGTKMFGKKVYKIMVDGSDCKYWNEYVLGRICGIASALGEPDHLRRGSGIPMGRNVEDVTAVICIETTKRRYRFIRNILNGAYPGLCKFEKV